jgi:hypothetical protein
MKYAIFLVGLICISSHSLFGQAKSSAESPIKNEDVIKMARAGLSSEVMIATIRKSACKFDTSPSSLVAMKEAGIADDVLMEMVRHPNAEQVVQNEPKAVPTPEVVVEPERPSDNLPEYGHISEIRKMRRVFVIADDIDSQNLLMKALRSYEGLQIVGSPDRAEIFVGFTQGSSATGVRLGGLFSGTIDHRTKAQFIVYYKSETGRSRIVWQETEDTQSSSGLVLSRPNEVNVAKHFIKALKKVRDD